MFQSLKDLFAGVRQAETPALDLSGAILMLEVACSDFTLSESEMKILRTRLSARFGLENSVLDSLIEEAMQQHDLTVSLREHIEVLNANYGPEEKRRFMVDLWQMAYADGELHHYEEAVIRRLADLLYIPHRDFIRTKHQVTAQP